MNTRHRIYAWHSVAAFCLLAALSAPKSLGAEVLSLTVGIDTTCPYGLVA